MSDVVIEGVVKKFGAFTAIESLDLTVREGEFLTLLGPSGCGKTTTLRMIAGFIDPSAGRILLDGTDITRVPPQKRQIGMVFQDYALFPHLSIADNIAFGLVERGASKADIPGRVEELLNLIQLPDVADRYPSELSGGQRQRIALARAVAYPPKVLLMDEPLGALDLKLRESMQFELRRIQQELGITTVYVTHDQVEAMTMSDRIAVMNLGRLIQLDDPETLYRRPRTRFVADFVGKINLLEGEVTGRQDAWDTVAVAGKSMRVPADEARPASGKVTLAVRPENLTLHAPGADLNGVNAVPGTVRDTVFTGNIVRLVAETESGVSLLVESRPDGGLPKDGEGVLVSWEPEATVVLDD